MGQLKAKACPVCNGENDGRWTCEVCTPIVNVHRELIRNLQAWRSLYEAREVDDVLIAEDGRSYCLWDVEHFYGQRFRVPPQQHRAIELCLDQNVLEKNAAVMMGVAPTNPVSVYATVGLCKMLALAVTGELPNYRISLEAAA